MEFASASVDTSAPGVRVSQRGDGSEPDISWLDLLRLLRENWWIMVVVPLLLAGILVALSLSQDRTYTASAAFRPQQAAGQQGIGGVAAQLGIAVPTANSGETPAFYARLLQSRTVLAAVVDSPFIRVAGGSSARFEDIMEIEEQPDAERRFALAMEALKEMTSVEISRETGVVEVTVTSPDPDFSVELLDRLIAQLNDFNLRQRQSQAAAERLFTESRLAEARADLREAEGRLQAFFQQNRQYMTSPVSQFEHDRLQREILHRQQLLLSLSQAFEQARIEEVRDIPVITLIDPPSPPTYPDSRGTLVKGIIGLILGSVLAIGIVLVREFSRGMRAGGRTAAPIRGG
jgi:uncharacterized protein involved in exopolysaccharide biosynthesis